ncbi:helix-turn-helix domain-containing protein [Tistrella mobilis]|uniref:Transcriptional regulator, XRE family n=2 Tax=Tistrella mobilis TaxID=171437 RepID=I3TWQ1_TISMK|nr:transcriptional regulator, XRE family [Tistrella mobilis KA081020-065]
MAITRMTLDEIMSRPAEVDQAKIDATTEADLRRHMIEDGQDPDAPLDTLRFLNPRDVRRRLGMTQKQFADALHIPLGTLRNWEQARTAPDPAGRALMIILQREPEAALRALRQSA